MGTREQGSLGPPERLVRSVLDGPSLVRGFEWHDRVTSTNELAGAAARAGAPEIHVVAADEQTAGRGRLGRRWHAPPGTSLMCSWLLRPPPTARPGLLPLTVGVAVAQVSAPHCPGADVRLKWPNDLLVDDRKCAGILVEAPLPGAVVVGTGINVDWRNVDRPPELAGGTSLAEAAGTTVDRWRLFAGLVGVLSRRYQQLADDPDGILDEYRTRCATLGRDVRVAVTGAERPIEGRAVAVDDGGALVVETPRRVTVHAGDVQHVRPA